MENFFLILKCSDLFFLFLVWGRIFIPGRGNELVKVCRHTILKIVPSVETIEVATKNSNSLTILKVTDVSN